MGIDIGENSFPVVGSMKRRTAKVHHITMSRLKCRHRLLARTRDTLLR